MVRTKSQLQRTNMDGPVIFVLTELDSTVTMTKKSNLNRSAYKDFLWKMWQGMKRRCAINQTTKSQISIFYIEKHIWLHSYRGDEEKLLEDFSELVEHQQRNKKMFKSKKKINFFQPGIK